MLSKRPLSFGGFELVKKEKPGSIHGQVSFASFVQCDTTVGSQEKVLEGNVRSNLGSSFGLVRQKHPESRLVINNH